MTSSDKVVAAVLGKSDPIIMIKKVVVVAAGVCGLILLNICLVVGLTWPITEFSVAKAGALGDSFGWLNSVFSGLAFLGVVWTLLHQQEEIKDARDSGRLERFEATFFELINMLRRNLDDIRVARPDGGEAVLGVEALSHFVKQVTERLERHKRWLEVPSGRLVYQRMIQKYARAVPLQGRYLGTLEAILELINRDLAGAKLRANYLGILSSQLTYAECRYLLLLALRGRTPDRLSQLVVAADPLMNRFADSYVSEMQRALFIRLYGFPLPKSVSNYQEILEGIYSKTRKDAEMELKQVARLKRGKRMSARRSGQISGPSKGDDPAGSERSSSDLSSN